MPPQRKRVEISFKQQAIDWIEFKGGGVPSRAEPHFRRLVWRVSASAFRRKPLLDAVEDALVDHLYDKRIRKEKVTREWIASTAIELFQASRTEEEHEDDPIRFVASNPCVQGFMTCNSLTLRKRTNLTTLNDEVLVERTVSYMSYLAEHKLLMNLERTILMDETAVYFEDSRTHTVDEIGARHVVIRSTGVLSMRITAALAVTASEKKLPPCLIWKRKARGSIERIGGCYVAYQERAWVDQTFIVNWLDWYVPDIAKAAGQYVVWDSMRSHIGKVVKQRCVDKDIKMAVIPGGLTPYLQAGDVVIYKSFKDNLSNIINEWKHSDKVRYTKGGNPRPPEVELVASWVLKAWRQTPESVITKSVSMCGFSDEPTSWHIARHDVYGTKFRMAWELQDHATIDSDEAIGDMMETQDDIVIED